MFRKLLALMLLLILSASMCASGAIAQSDNEIPVYEVVITDDGLEFPGAVAPGIAAVHYENVREESFSSPGLYYLDDLTLDEFYTMFEAAMTEFMSGEFAGATDEFRASVTELGGSFMPPGNSIEIIYDLQPGQYVLMEFVRESPAIVEFEISSDAEKVVEAIDADIAVDIVENAYVMPDEIDAGQHVWEITNSSDVDNEIVLVHIMDDSLSQEDITDMLTSGAEPSEDQAMSLFSFTGIRPDRKAWVRVDLEAGRYLVASFAWDENGEVYAQKGMFHFLTVN
jgi:hypothetical protein